MYPGKRLKHYRLERGYTISEAAKCIGSTPKTLSDYENNRRKIPVSIIIKLAQLYNYDVVKVLGVYEDRFVEYDISVYYYIKAHFMFVVREEIKKDRAFGNELSEVYYTGRLRSLLDEYVSDPIYIANHPDIKTEYEKDTDINIKL